MAEYKIIDGKATSIAIKKEIAEEVERIVAAGGKRPHLAAVLVGHDGGSETYVKNKVIACEQCGFVSSLIRYEEDVTEEELLACVNSLNSDEDIDGFIVQLPLPKHIDEQKIIMAIDYRKDVDGFHPIDSIGYTYVAAPLQYRDIWKEVCRARAKQHRRKAHGPAHDAEAIWRLYCYRLPLPFPESQRGV